MIHTVNTRAFVLLAIVGAMTLWSTTMAQPERAQTFDIPARPLPSALLALAEQAGIEILFDSRITAGRTAPGVAGRHTVAEALSRLLAGSGLLYRFTGSDSVTLERAGATDGDSLTLDPIRVEAQDGGVRGADGANSITVTRGDLERRNPPTMKEVFAGESAVSVGGAIPLAQKIYVNGIEERNLAVSIDGARQNNKVFHHTATNVIDPSLLKLARVDPGVAPADAGPGALGGAIVYETVDVDDLLEPGRDLGAFLSGGYASNGRTLRAGGSMFGRSQGFEALGFVQHTGGNDYRAGDGETVPGTAADLLSLLGKVAYQQAGHRLELSAEQVRDHANRPFRANIGAIIGRPDPVVRRYELTRRNFTLNYSLPEATGLWDPELVLGYGVTDLAVPEPYGSEGETGSLSAKLGNRFRLSPNTSLSIGADFYRDRASYADPDTPEVQERAANFGLYAQARMQAFEALELSAGVRGDRQAFKGLDGTEMTDHGLSGNASLVYHLSDALRLTAGYSDVWGGIALAENFILNPAWAYDDIDPVRARNRTLGFAYETDAFTFEGRVFRSDFRNARDPSWGGGPALTTDFRSEGFTVGIGYRWRQGFVRLSYTDSEITSQGEPVSSYAIRAHGAPLGRVIALEAAHWLSDVDLMIGATLDAGLKNTSTVDAGGLAQEAYEVLNLYAEYRPRQQHLHDLRLRFEVNNVFDEDYADRATYGQDFESVRPLSEPGRSLGLSVRLDF